MKRVITFGTFDLIHIGHLNILHRAKALGDHLTVGVSTDALNYSKKGHNPIFSEKDRVALISEMKSVDEVFLEESLEKKLDYIKKYKSDVLVMGYDWKGKFDFASELCEVVYLPRTPDVSSTDIKLEVVKRTLS